MTDNQGDEPYQRIKVTVTAYYVPDLSPNGGYWEQGGEYSPGFLMAKTIADAAAYDYFNYREGHFDIEEYLNFSGADGDFDVKVEVVTCIGQGDTYEEVCTSDVSAKVDREMFGGNENLTDDLPGMWEKSDIDG